MLTRYPAAEWRPLGEQTEPGITPRILIVHTMVGYLRSTDTMFRKQGYTGTESHFGVGGPWDSSDLDGAVWQWQSIDRQADAQNAGMVKVGIATDPIPSCPEPSKPQHRTRPPRTTAQPWFAPAASATAPPRWTPSWPSWSGARRSRHATTERSDSRSSADGRRRPVRHG